MFFEKDKLENCTILCGSFFENASARRRKGVIAVAVKSREVPDFYNAVHSADNKAFIINLHSNEVNGEGFEIYR